jgi:hypothetical protein
MLGLANEVDEVDNMEDKRFSEKKKYIRSWGHKDLIRKALKKLAKVSQ